MYICNECPMYISHIHVYGHGTLGPTSLLAGCFNSAVQIRVAPKHSLVMSGEGTYPFIVVPHMRRRFGTADFFLLFSITVVIYPSVADIQVLGSDSIRGQWAVRRLSAFSYLFFSFPIFWALQLRYSNSQLLSSGKTRLTITLRLRTTSKETSTLQQLLKAERTTKSSSNIRKSSAQMKWVSCTAATIIQRVISSISKCTHLLWSSWQGSEMSFIYLPTQCQWWSGNPLRWGCRNHKSRPCSNKMKAFFREKCSNSTNLTPTSTEIALSSPAMHFVWDYQQSGRKWCTPKIIRIYKLLLLNFLQFQKWLKCFQELEVHYGLHSTHRAQSISCKFSVAVVVWGDWLGPMPDFTIWVFGEGLCSQIASR